MSGTVMLGAASDQNQGIVNRTQFGAGDGEARRRRLTGCRPLRGSTVPVRC